MEQNKGTSENSYTYEDVCVPTKNLCKAYETRWRLKERNGLAAILKRVAVELYIARMKRERAARLTNTLTVMRKLANKLSLKIKPWRGSDTGVKSQRRADCCGSCDLCVTL